MSVALESSGRRYKERSIIIELNENSSFRRLFSFSVVPCRPPCLAVGSRPPYVSRA
jgi:hypothetical protein